MCGRFVSVITPEMLVDVFGVVNPSQLPTRYNLAPTQLAPVVRSSSDGNRIDELRWGLVLPWKKEFDSGLINARCETVSEKPSFRNSIKSRRCIVPMMGFYEWKSDGGMKCPYYISLSGGQPMGIAGLWEPWKSPEGMISETFCILTTSANRLMESIHERMPVILHPSEYDHWLSKDLTDPKQFENLYQPYPADMMAAVEVSPAVNSPRNDSADLILPIRH